MSRLLLALALAAGIFIGALAALWWRGPADRAGTERIVREYLLAYPEVIPEAMQRLQARESARALTGVRDRVTRPYAGAWIGNPQGDVTVVEYFDYNCGYCRAVAPMLRELVAGDPKVRVVFRELPVLAPSSREAAEASLAAAQQGRFAAFHDALFAGGRITKESIAAAARQARVDLARLDRAAADAEIARNLEDAGRLGIAGTPGWIIGNRLLSGAMPLDALRQAVAEARAK